MVKKKISMRKVEEISLALWALALELEVEAERYDGLSENILGMAFGLFDDPQRNLPPDALEKYLRITKAQPGIRLTLDERRLYVERTLWVQSLADPVKRITVRDLSPYEFSPEGEAERNHLALLSILFEEFESKAVIFGLGRLSQGEPFSLPQFKFFVSLLDSSVRRLGER
ncbi:hypothetical protein [Rufibacter sp. XAAS-G3-1]|uniref:hypothetical protein n=1 Tax=Rufibacter sp. XAAS-G3-1 TaxID=2729134 RepID=UPI0015E7D8A5|nr:hypothetical protein [Rufibacter sp. XAAS-G3-1]